MQFKTYLQLWGIQKFSKTPPNIAPKIGEVYKSTRDQIPVYRLRLENGVVMRRCSDDWINATHILRVAGFSPTESTGILKKENRKRPHDIVAEGHFEYHGTWIPLNDGLLLAKQYRVFDRIHKLFEPNPGRPKHPYQEEFEAQFKDSRTTEEQFHVLEAHFQAHHKLFNNVKHQIASQTKLPMPMINVSAFSNVSSLDYDLTVDRNGFSTDGRG